MIIATVRAMESQRCVCRIHLFQFNVTSFEDEQGCPTLCRARCDRVGILTWPHSMSISNQPSHLRQNRAKGWGNHDARVRNLLVPAACVALPVNSRFLVVLLRSSPRNDIAVLSYFPMGKLGKYRHCFGCFSEIPFAIKLNYELSLAFDDQLGAFSAELLGIFGD